MPAHREWFDPAAAEAKVVDYVWHMDRHTFASRLAMAGGSIHAIAKLMGHATIKNEHAVCPLQNQRDTKADTNQTQ